MDRRTVTCMHCPAEGIVEAAVSARGLLPMEWMWWTRRAEGLGAAPCCSSCWSKLSPDRNLRRVGGPFGRIARGGTRG